MAALTDVFPLEQFRILGPIGKGEFGKVHRATWTDGQVDVALKQVEAAQGETKLLAEQQGVRLQDLVWQRHPEIVPRVYRDGTAPNGDYFIAMEFVRGESLHDILQRKRLSTADALRLATIVAGFLQKLHSFDPPILHSDLKPEHVLVLDDGTVRIIDFGIAKRPEFGAATHNAFLSVMYAAPERVEDEARNVHPSDDLWALGIMLFEMLAGEHPREAYRARIEDAVRRDDLITVANLLRERPGLLPAECSPQLDAIVRKMLAPQPGHRYATALQVLADLENYAHGRETVAWQQLVAAGRATRVVSRPRSAAAGAPTLLVPPPLPEYARAQTARTPDGAPEGAHRVVTSIPAGPRDVGGHGVTTSVPPATAAKSGRAAAVIARPRRRFASKRSFGVVLRAIVALMIARAIIGEGVAWSRVERFRARIPTFQTADLPSIPPMVNSLRDMGMGFSASRVYAPLADRMLELAEPTIADYRTDMPTAKLPQWRAAASALRIASDVQPGSRRIRARVRYVDGQLLRIEAQGKAPDAARPLFDRAAAAFRDAARLDSAWPDPFVGLATVHAYGLRDPDAVVEDVDQAAQRGFDAGRREHAEMADAFSYRGDQARADAARLDGDERRNLLNHAQADYQACIDHYAGVTAFFNSDRNMEHCRQSHAVITMELAVDPIFDLLSAPF
jgi:predicted Ser/Thr protein kinase